MNINFMMFKISVYNSRSVEYIDSKMKKLMKTLAHIISSYMNRVFIKTIPIPACFEMFIVSQYSFLTTIAFTTT